MKGQENMDEGELALSLIPPPPLQLLQDSPPQPASSSSSTNKQGLASKRKMLSFAIPALGIFLCNPLLSNIDNAFVGQTVGTQGLAAMSPATICTDQMLFFFSFLGRATTGLVSRAYKYDEETGLGDNQAVREAASSPLSVALLAGGVVSLLYALFTPRMLTALQVAPSLRAPAASYIYWRGAITWAALAQNVILNILLATRDAITPLKIVILAALVNVVGDFMCCVWPLRMGCGGAAAATAFATLLSSFFMVQSLKRKHLLPPLHFPTKQQLVDLMEFTGPLLAITLTRLIGSINMQRAASRLGVQQLAAYQMSINVMWLFMLFGEPLSQLSQTQLPALVDDTERATGPLIQATLKSIFTLGACTAVSVASVAGLLMKLGPGIFSSDVAVQSLASNVAPALFMAVAAGIFTGKYSTAQHSTAL
jgi:Na+-driven multidrug efflux pump